MDTLTEKPRIASIDIMRGIVMIIMALDHTRDFIHADASLFDPTDLTKTNPVLFFTRLITHFCAPTFVFLSGVSARISRQRKSTKELSLFLLTRGLWLILLELTIVRFGLMFNPYYDFTFLQVIWAIGASMVVMSAIIFLPQRIILALGLLLVFGHNMLDTVQVKPEGVDFALWTLMIQAGAIPIAPQSTFFVPYPLIPWLGIMVTGYGIGFLFDPGFDGARRRKILFTAGVTAILLFIVLRFINWYGDPRPWTPQKNAVFTLMSFLNVTKYPVSLMYTLMTLGPVLIILPWMENLRRGALEPFRIVGRVPLFYYILHFYLIHFVSLCLYMITTGRSWPDLDFHFSKGFGGIPPGAGYSLGWAYIVWLCIVTSLYPICKWYYRYKNTHHQWWLSYL